MGSYQKKIAGNPKVELVHVSYDDDAAAAQAWAKKEGFPWPTVMADKRKASDLEKFAGEYVPEYILLDKDGKVLAKGKDECFAALPAS